MVHGINLEADARLISPPSTEQPDAPNVVDIPPERMPWHHRAREWLNFPLGRFLDYGCGHGELMRMVEKRCTELHGVDVNPRPLEWIRRHNPAFKLNVIDVDGKTEYPDEYFDTIAIVEVIEHVANESETLAELNRILKPGGTLLLTTPHKGLLTFLDVGNFKFVFPSLHQFIHCKILRNSDYYSERFVENKKIRLIGDITVTDDRRPWHRHYRVEEIGEFCSPNLRLVRSAVFFPGLRLTMLMRQILRVFSFGLIDGTFEPLSSIERRLNDLQSPHGDQLVTMWTKKDGEVLNDERSSTSESVVNE